MHHIFIDEKLINGDNVILTEKDEKDTFNHLKVLRINLNEKVLISPYPYKEDKNYIASVIQIDSNEFGFKIISVDKKRELLKKIYLYMGLIKKDNFEWIIEKATELGVYKIIPVLMEYSKSNFISGSLNKFKRNNIESAYFSEKDYKRLNLIAKNASIQCNRSYIPEVSNIITINEMYKFINENYNNVLFYENKNGLSDTRIFLDDLKNDNRDINIVIGPEGGFSQNEINEFSNMNIKILSLGDRVLRAETAAIAAVNMISIYV